MLGLGGRGNHQQKGPRVNLVRRVGVYMTFLNYIESCLLSEHFVQWENNSHFKLNFCNEVKIIIRYVGYIVASCWGSRNEFDYLTACINRNISVPGFKSVISY